MAAPDEIDPAVRGALAIRGERPIVLIDGRNVQRSSWPNIGDEAIVRRSCEWGRKQAMLPVIVFDGPTAARGDGESCFVVPVLCETADQWMIRVAASLGRLGAPFWLVTSDRELRRLAGRNAGRVIGGGGFLKQAPQPPPR